MSVVWVVCRLDTLDKTLVEEVRPALAADKWRLSGVGSSLVGLVDWSARVKKLHWMVSQAPVLLITGQGRVRGRQEMRFLEMEIQT